MKIRDVRSVIAGATVLGILSVSSLQATIYTLAPGAFVPSINAPFPAGGTLLANSGPVAFSAGVLSGTLTSQVLLGDPANPYGGLTFTYQFSVSAASANGASQLSVSSFDSFFTDVSYNNAGGGIAPSNFSRSSEGGGAGDVVRFSFFSPAVFAGQTSDLLVVQTSAQNFNQTTAGIIDGQTANVFAFAPFPVPEPGVAALLLAGLAAVRLIRRK